MQMLPTYSKLLLITLFLTAFLPSKPKKAPHPLHVSTTEVNFNQKENILELSCRIFTDDLESVLAKTYKTKVDLTQPALHKAMDNLVQQYLNSHLQYTVNGKSVSATYVGFEIDHEATNVYLEITKVSNLQKLSINNSLMYDLFDDQMNILHVENAGIRKSVRLNYPDKLMAVSFN